MKTFPILNYATVPGCPSSVDWLIVAAHEEQAIKNHGQTVTRLAERGGLHVLELYYILRDERYPISNLVSMSHAVEYLQTRISLAAGEVLP